ncbi:MAG: ACP S-malonyltransferase [bacterium]|nr:ACP S-malonyltransferase [bacterium]
MSNFAFVFPGQGAQFVGMGKDLYEKYNEIKSLYEKANEILGIDIKKISFEGPENELKESKNAQIAIVLHSVASYNLLIQKGVTPSVTAGHSLGEYAALIAANAIDFDDALQLVRFRGELMSRAGEASPGTMAAVLGMPADKIEQIISEIGSPTLVVANYNSPMQTVISGDIEGIKKASELLKTRGAKRVMPLQVSGAFHSPLMESAFKTFKLALEKIEIKNPSIPVVPNVTGKLTSSAEEIKENLGKQIISSVRWVDTVKNIVSAGTTSFVELGPGKVLTGLIKQISPEAELTGLENYS